MAEQQTVLQLAAAMSDAPAPIYQRVKQAIVNQIRAGHWQPHQRVPSESELVAELGVSRMTINRALRELTSEGFLIRMQGVGTFVAGTVERRARRTRRRPRRRGRAGDG